MRRQQIDKLKIRGVLIEHSMEVGGLTPILPVTLEDNCGLRWVKDAEDAVKLKYKLTANFGRHPSEVISVKSREKKINYLYSDDLCLKAKHKDIFLCVIFFI